MAFERIKRQDNKMSLSQDSSFLSPH